MSAKLSESKDLLLHFENTPSPRRIIYVNPHASWFRHTNNDFDTEGTWAGRVITSWRVPGKDLDAPPPRAPPHSYFSSLGVRDDLVQGNIIRDFNCRYRAAPRRPKPSRSRGRTSETGLERPPSPRFSARPPSRNPIFDVPSHVVTALPMSLRTTNQSYYRPPLRPATAQARTSTATGASLTAAHLATLEAQLKESRRWRREADEQVAAASADRRPSSAR